MAAFVDFFRSQIFVKLPYPTEDFTGQTVIVTGSNTGLGFEAARHVARLNASKVILAVRSLERGETARKSILESTKRSAEVVEVWQLDLSSYASVKHFAERAKGLPRLDVLLENAGITTDAFTKAEDHESIITVNVISTFLLALLLLPKLRETATKFNVVPRLVIVSSEVHGFTSFPERKEESIFETLKSEDKARMTDRYNVSKLLEVFTVRELASQTEQQSDKAGNVIINTVNPGFCHSEFLRDVKGTQKAFITVMKAAFARTTEEGSRTLVHAAAAGQDSHGKYLGDCSIKNPSKFVLSPEGAETQKRVWRELSQILEKIQPGILQNV